MKTLFVLASVMVVLFLAAPNRIEAQKRKATRPKQAYVLNESRAKALVEDYVRSHRGTTVTVSVQDFAQGLNEETLVNYMTDEPQRLTVQKAFVMKLARAGMLNVHSRVVTIPNIAGEYEPQSNVDGACSYHFKISHVSPTSPFVSGSAKYVTSLYRKCDWGHEGNVRGVVDESGDIFLSLAVPAAYAECKYILVNNTLQPKGGGTSAGSTNGLTFKDFRRTTGDMPPISVTKYKYSLTDEAKALGLRPNGGEVKIGEMTIDRVSDLLLQGETNATGRVRFSIRYTKLRAVLMPGGQESGTITVRFGQTPDRRWVVVGL
ncbi:MAG: hypothetical protein AABN95_26905 [Acidobacteriota bacterium]